MRLLTPKTERQIKEFCIKYHIKKVALFGSYLKGKERKDSDIDFLIEFKEDHKPSYFELSKMQNELSQVFQGKKVDLRTPEDLSRYFRSNVIAEAEVLFSE